MQQNLATYFNTNDLIILCFHMGIQYEDVIDQTLQLTTIKLIEYVERNSMHAKLLEACEALRPGRGWLQTEEAAATGIEMTEWQSLQEQAAVVNASLRGERLPAYKKLWSYLEPLAKYARPAPFTYQAAATLSATMRMWYFQVGGIYLSEGCRMTYFALQEALEKIVETPGFQEKANEELSEKEFESLRRKGSRLRDSLAADLGTRR